MAHRGEPADKGKPFDIGDYQKTLVELSNSAQQLTKLAATVERITSEIGVDELIAKVIKAMEDAESESERLGKYTARMLLVIIGVWFAAYIIAKLLILYVSNKMKVSANLILVQFMRISHDNQPSNRKAARHRPPRKINLCRFADMGVV